MKELFLCYLEEEFFKDYHGDKEHFEDDFNNWLQNLDNSEIIEYGNRAINQYLEPINF